MLELVSTMAKCDLCTIPPIEGAETVPPRRLKSPTPQYSPSKKSKHSAPRFLFLEPFPPITESEFVGPAPHTQEEIIHHLHSGPGGDFPPFEVSTKQSPVACSSYSATWNGWPPSSVLLWSVFEWRARSDSEDEAEVYSLLTTLSEDEQGAVGPTTNHSYQLQSKERWKLTMAAALVSQAMSPFPLLVSGNSQADNSSTLLTSAIRFGCSFPAFSSKPH